MLTVPATEPSRLLPNSVSRFKSGVDILAFRTSLTADRSRLILPVPVVNSPFAVYVLSLLGNKAVQWKQLGYAWYLGYCIDPYNEELVGGEMNDSIEKAPYYEAYVRGGGGKELNTETFRKLNDAASYVCLTQGMNWGTPYESWALRKTGVYSGPAKVQDPGDDMSVMMATSFIAYLSDKYGFEDVSDFCFGMDSFEKTFGTDYQTAYSSWTEWILETYGE